MGRQEHRPSDVIGETPAEATEPPSLIARRSLLTACATGLVAFLAGALGEPRSASAAAGQPLVMGLSNSAGTANTSLTTASPGVAFKVTQRGAGTALRGSATAIDGIAGFFTSSNGPGISGVTASPDKHAVYAANDATTSGSGAALRASGIENDGIVATTAAGAKVAGSFTNTSQEPSATALRVSAPNGVAIQASGRGGIAGSSTDGTGVAGGSMTGTGVSGVSESQGVGVRGTANSGGIGVHGLGSLGAIGVVAEHLSHPREDTWRSSPFRIVPSLGEPDAKGVGEMYVDVDGGLHVYDGTTWRQVVYA